MDHYLMENYCPEPLCEYNTMRGVCSLEKGCVKASTEKMNIKTNTDMHLQQYSIEPFYGQAVADGTNRISYILRIPTPLDEEQMNAILMIIKEMRSPRSYTGDKCIVTDWRRSNE